MMRLTAKEVTRVVRAVATDQLARLAPKSYLRLTGQTGRGAEEETPAEIAAYYRRCFADYLAVLGLAEREARDYFDGKRILEYGPGDMPGMAMLFYAYGAEQVICIDRFPMVNWSAKNRAVLTCLCEGLDGAPRQRASEWLRAAAHGSAGSTAGGAISYLVKSSGLSSLKNAVDLVVSRAVLEHVDDLAATFADMYQALRDGGVAVHQVDLKSHGLHRHNPLDFLTWPSWLWTLMYGHKGVPNRWRVDRYRQLVDAQGFRVVKLAVTTLAEPSDIAEVRPRLAAPFRTLSDEDLSWLGFWLLVRKESVKVD